jgi:amino acid transporter
MLRDLCTAPAVSHVAKLFPLLLFVGIGLWHVAWGRLQPASLPPNTDFAKAVLLLSFALVGCESVVVAAGETKNPRRDPPRALITGLALVAMLYGLTQLVFPVDLGIERLCADTTAVMTFRYLLGTSLHQMPLVGVAHHRPVLGYNVAIKAIVPDCPPLCADHPRTFARLWPAASVPA